jgi:hypothetical protein
MVHKPFLHTSPSVKTPFVSHMIPFPASIHPAFLPSKSKPSTNGVHVPEIHTDLKIEPIVEQSIPLMLFTICTGFFVVS